VSTTAARILGLLRAAGVETVFGLPGVHNLAFWQAWDDTTPRLMTVRHEQTAGYAADGWARSTGGLGVAVVTSGPGAANVVAAFGEAAASGSPVLVVASDVPEGQRDRTRVRGLLHESRDQGALFAPLAKAVFQPTTPADAVAAAADAIEAAMSHPRGPVYLGVPSDVLAAAAPEPRALQLLRPATAPSADVAAAADLLNAASRPVLWVGGGAVASGAAEAVDALAWRLGAPVVTTYAGRGVLPPGHPMLVDAPPHEPAVADLLAEADTLLVLGSALDGMTTRNWAMPRPRRVVDVNLAPSGSLDPDLTLVGDVRDTVDALALRLRPRGPWADSPFRLRDTVRRAAAADPDTVDAVALVDAVERGWPDDGVVVCDMAVAGYWVGGYATVPRPRALAYPVGWGTLGFGLPAAIGAASAGRSVLAVVGDGGLAMGLGELATLVQEDLPVTVLLVDDGGYGMLRFDVERTGGTPRGVDLLGPDWRQLAASFHLAVDEVDDAAALRDALAWSALAGEPRLVVHRAALHPPRTTSPRWADPR
jgi:thiamine pyrophosphate-dependent acetolactate synthase large subunit-like protein